MKKIAILGSTGSIGKNTLDVIRHHPDNFKAVGLSVCSDIGTLDKQIKEFKPYFVCVKDKEAGFKLIKKISPKIKVFVGEEGLNYLVREKKIDQIMFAISGSAALEPLINAIDAGKDIALANKEALVMAGPIIMDMASKKNVNILPVDSEQSAIWQCLKNEEKVKLKNIYLTASGGSLKDFTRQAIKKVSLKTVLKHPRWKMGKKITVDSATLMNKGLEVLEAMFLFNVSSKNIKVLIHPEALIHSMVEFIDGIIIAQISATDMRIPIQYALSFPERLPGNFDAPDFFKLSKLHFEKPDFDKFPCLRLAYQAADTLGTLPCVLNAANEVAVGEFLKEKLRFVDISSLVEKVMLKHKVKNKPSLEDIRDADSWAKQEAYKCLP